MQYFNNVAYRWKMLFILLAGLNLFAFWVTGTSKAVDSIGADQEAPPLAKVMAGASLFLWIGVMFWGRMLPFIGSAF